jgi:arylsulfatase A-like enzyme
VDIRQAVSLIDLGPTLLDVIGISAPSSLEGGSLAPVMGRARPPGFFEKLTGSRHKAVSPVYSELLQVQDGKPTVSSVPLRSVVVGARKLILHQDGTAEAYDLAADPDETNAGALTANDRSALQETIARLGQVSQSSTPVPATTMDTPPGR